MVLSCALLPSFQVFFPQRGKKGERGELIGGSEWELLNLETASILDMPDDVEKLTGLEHSAFMDVMSDYLYESIGTSEFCRRHPLAEKARVMIPSTAHISFTKAVTMLGLGKNALVPVAVDEDSRMDASGKLAQPRVPLPGEEVDSHIKLRGLSSYVPIGVQIRCLVPLRVFKYKMTTSPLGLSQAAENEFERHSRFGYTF